jgi:hypothetical protein
LAFHLPHSIDINVRVACLELDASLRMWKAIFLFWTYMIFAMFGFHLEFRTDFASKVSLTRSARKQLLHCCEFFTKFYFKLAFWEKYSHTKITSLQTQFHKIRFIQDHVCRMSPKHPLIVMVVMWVDRRFFLHKSYNAFFSLYNQIR